MAEAVRDEAEEEGRERATRSSMVSEIGFFGGALGSHGRLQSRGGVFCMIPLGWVS